MPVSEATYEAVALEDPEGRWELYDGRLRSKPTGTMAQNTVEDEAGFLLMCELRSLGFQVRLGGARIRSGARWWLVPDVMVIPRAIAQKWRERPYDLESYSEPLPLVVEVWSPSTGEYDVDEKLPEYRRRGDAEIWCLHPYDRELTAWRRQPDGSYTEHHWLHGMVELHAIPGVSIDLDALFAVLDR